MQLLLALIVTQAFAQDFSKYPATTQDINCKELDFDSYHKVQNVKTNMLRKNPDRAKPNFAGKYLLLKNDFLFSDAWFVADCTTGKFVKEMLSTDHKDPRGDFRADSALLVVSSQREEKKIPSEHHVFQNEKWMKVEVPTPTPSPTASPTATTTATTTVATTIATPPADEPQFKQFSVPLAKTCKEIDFNSNSRAQSAKKTLMENTPDRSQPNFAGRFLLLKGDTIFQTYWLIADCETGKILPELITGGAYFEKDSRLFKIYSSGSAATYQVWDAGDQQWIVLQGKNKVYGKNAKALFDALPNKGKSDTLRFEKVQHRLWEMDLSIKSGKCMNDNGKYTCEIEI